MQSCSFIPLVPGLPSLCSRHLQYGEEFPPRPPIITITITLRMCTASPTLTITRPWQWRSSSVPRTPQWTATPGQGGPSPSTSWSPSSSSPPSSPSSATRPSSGSSGNLPSQIWWLRLRTKDVNDVMTREVAGLTISGGGGGHTIRCHHFIIHQDREISVRSGVVTYNSLLDFISYPIPQLIKPIWQ